MSFRMCRVLDDVGLVDCRDKERVQRQLMISLPQTDDDALR